MLNALRKQAGSWVVKALLLILVLSFAIWGVGDIFYGNPQQATVAEVGDAEITANELNDAFNRQVDNLQRQFGGQLTREQAISFGLMQQTLQELVDQRMVDQETQKLGITVADDTLRDLIVENPAFQSAGRFDRLRFQQLLATTGLSEDGYLEVLRQDLARSTLTGSMLAPVTVPEILVERLYGYRNEARRGRVLKVLSAGIDDLPEPGEDELETLYESDEARFTAPEYRSIDYVALTPEQLLDEIEVPFDEVQAAYDARAAQYRSPERREVEQLLIQDEAVVEEAKALIAEGKSFEEVAEALQDQGVSRTDLGNVTAADMPAGLGEAAFAVPEGEVSDVVESPFGKHLFHIAAVTPEEVTPIGEVQNEIERELALEQAADRLPDLAAQLDDELAAGSSVEDAAAALGIDSQTATLVDRQGQNQEGERDPDLPPWPELLATAFDAPVDQPGLLEETDDGSYFVIEVKAVEEPRLKPLDEVRDEVVALWEDQKRAELAEERAETLKNRLAEAATFESLEGEDGVELAAIEPLKRGDSPAGSGLSAAALNALFATEPGAVAEEVVPVEGGYGILINDEVIAADPAEDELAFDQLEDELRRQMQNDLMSEYGQALRASYPVTIEERTLNRLMSGDSLQQSGGPAPAPQIF